MREQSDFSSRAYWEARYQAGGTSGSGSYGRLADFKAKFINAFAEANRVSSVLDLGCGDGNLLSLLRLKNYTGVDASATVLARCAARFANRDNHRFCQTDEFDRTCRVDMAMSIDVIFHLVEDTVFERHMDDLFVCATRFVLIYASNHESTWPDPHVRHRRFSEFVRAQWPEWQLLAHLPNRFPYDSSQPGETSFADFFVFGCTAETCVLQLPAI